MEVATFYDVVSASEATFWTIWRQFVVICEDGSKFGDEKREYETCDDVSDRVSVNWRRFGEVLG